MKSIIPVSEIIPVYTTKMQHENFQNIMDDPTFILRGVTLEGGADARMSVMQAADLELNGGPCPLCGEHFERRSVDGKHGKFVYYVPGLKCHCFPICSKVWHRVKGTMGETVHVWRPGCGRNKIVETLLGVKYCLNCQTHESSQEYNGRMMKPKKKAEAVTSPDEEVQL